jgi:hypothetical protein
MLTRLARHQSRVSQPLMLSKTLSISLIVSIWQTLLVVPRHLLTFYAFTVEN